MIFQGYNLLEQRTALKNVCFPLEIKKVKKRDAEKRALELLGIVGLKDRAGAYPSQLSGGQKQRVAIARALAADPKVLLCDEATSALDPDTTDSILALIKDINRQLGVTVIIITHEMKVIEKICNKVAVIDGGVIAESGFVSDVFVSPKSDMGRRLILKGQPPCVRKTAERLDWFSTAYLPKSPLFRGWQPNAACLPISVTQTPRMSAGTLTAKCLSK